VSAPLFVFVPGWALEPDFWDPLRAALPYDSVTLELCADNAGAVPRIEPGRPIVAVGHSTGVLWLLAEKPFSWDALVSINGFSRFSKADDFPHGVAVRLLERMIRGLETDARRTVEDFLKRCGLDDAPRAPLNIEHLKAGLELLRTGDARDVDPGPVLALGGRTDPIVPPPLAEDCFSAIEWRDGGHLLPLTATGWCAEKIRQFVEPL